MDSKTQYQGYSKRKKIQKRSDRLFSLTRCFVMIWMFALGVFVGRDVCPVRFDTNEFRDDLKEIKELAVQQKNQLIQKVSALTQKSNLDFYEALKKDDILMLAPEDIAQFKTMKQHPVMSEKLDIRKATYRDQLEDRILWEQTQRNSHILLENKKNTFTLQVAAVQNAASAVELLDVLKEKGYPAYTLTITIPEKGMWYRIRVGEFLNKDDAQRIQARLKRDNHYSIIVPYIVESEYGYTIAKDKLLHPES